MLADPTRLSLRVPSAAAHAASALFALVGALTLLTTRPQLSATIDENNHLAAGLEWWQHGSYTWFTENPPLGRVAVAAVPYWTGMRLPPRSEWDPHTHSISKTWWVGLDLLHGGAGYQTNLLRARLGIFPFYLLALLAVWLLAGGRRRPIAGLLAVGLTATLPPLVAHASLATTDVPFLGTFLVAVLALRRWFDRPSPARAAWLGAALAGAMLAKFTTLIFFPVVLVALLLARRLADLTARPSIPGGRSALPARAVAAQSALALAVAMLVVWGGYRFSWGAVGELPEQAIGWFRILPPPGERGVLTRRLLAMRGPFPELFHGLLFLGGHNAAGHTAYLLGETSRTGFRGFYPLAFLVKTPLPFLAATLAGLFCIVRQRRWPEGWWWAALALAAAAILALSTRNRINLGFRHVMVLQPLLAVAIGGALASALSRSSGGLRPTLVAAAVTLLVLQGAGTWRTRPNLLGWFNPLAGRDPAGVLLDSDNDWGQDLLQLRRELQARQVPALHIAYFGLARLCAHGLPPLEPLRPGHPTRGWIAISENFYRERNTLWLTPDPCDPLASYRPGDVPRHPFAWLAAYQPVAIVGSSIRLYWIP